MKVVKLKDCVLKILDCRGKTPKKLGSDWVNKGIKVISANNVHDGILTNKNEIRYVTEDIYRKWMKEPVLKGDCFLSSEGATLGESMYWDSDEKIVLGQRLYSIRTNPQILDSKYFSMYLRSDICQKLIKNISTGSTVFGISQKDLLNLNIIVPDIKNQQKIGILYYNINKKIELNNKINVELEDMAKTIYNYWFLQFEFPNEEGKPYKSSGGKMVWNEELKREIPEGWKVVTLKNNIRIIKGISYTSKNIDEAKGTPMINLASININRKYNPNQLKFFTGSYNINKEVTAFDMLVACTDLTRNADIIGSPILVPNDDKKYIYSMDLAKIEVMNSKIIPLYLYMTLRTSFYHKYIKGFASGTNVLHLDTKGIEAYTVYIPNKKIQQSFANILYNIHCKQSNIISENQELTSLRDFLLPLLMNGQVGFKD